jgi:hypothetical protein
VGETREMADHAPSLDLFEPLTPSEVELVLQLKDAVAPTVQVGRSGPGLRGCVSFAPNGPSSHVHCPPVPQDHWAHAYKAAARQQGGGRRVAWARRRPVPPQQRARARRLPAPALTPPSNPLPPPAEAPGAAPVLQ